MGSIDSFLPGLAAGSNAVATGSDVVDGGAGLFGTVLEFLGGLVSKVTETLGS